MTHELIITMRHVRQAKMCSRGVRDFFIKHNLDWDLFLKEGISAAKLEATGDAMAINVVRMVKNGRK